LLLNQRLRGSWLALTKILPTLTGVEELEKDNAH
jgi:hypothetical protein